MHIYHIYAHSYTYFSYVSILAYEYLWLEGRVQ